MERHILVMDDTADHHGLRSVTIAINVLEAFANAPELGVTEIAHQLGIAKSTAHRALTALAAGGLIERTLGGRYRLGLRILELGQITANRLELRRAALPVLTNLRNASNEMAQLGLPAGTEVHYVERIEALPGCRFTSDVYRRVPANASSAGKVLAAFNPTMAEACVREGLRPRTPYTITHVPKFLSALTEIRSQGWVLSIEEAELGIASVAAPVIPRGSQHAVGAISIAGPVQRFVERRDVLVKLVTGAGRELARAVTKPST